MDIKKLMAAGILALAALTTSAIPTVTDVVAKQRYPWNGLVDITCTVSGIDGAGNDHYFSVAAVMPDTGNTQKISHLWVVKNGANSINRTVSANGSYWLLWDATADLGKVAYDNMVISVIVKTRNKVQLWAGGPYWADMNIGAENPEGYGYYFWWGDTIGYKRENNAWVASDGSSSNFSFDSSNTPTDNKSIATLKSEGWITADNVLTPAHDAAHVHWGGKWRMPTQQELSDLNSKCTWFKTAMNGVQGYRVSGKGDYSSNSIFLPLVGVGRGTSLYGGIDANSGYWSSLPRSVNYAWCLFFHFGAPTTGRDTNSFYCYYGFAVRPVQGVTE